MRDISHLDAWIVTPEQWWESASAARAHFEELRRLVVQAVRLDALDVEDVRHHVRSLVATHRMMEAVKRVAERGL